MVDAPPVDDPLYLHEWRAVYLRGYIPTCPHHAMVGWMQAEHASASTFRQIGEPREQPHPAFVMRMESLESHRYHMQKRKYSDPCDANEVSPLSGSFPGPEKRDFYVMIGQPSRAFI